jgi:hypothetical protein
LENTKAQLTSARPSLGGIVSPVLNLTPTVPDNFNSRFLSHLTIYNFIIITMAFDADKA